MNISFAHPLCLLLLAPIAFAVWRMLRRRRGGALRFSALRRIPASAKSWRTVLSAIAPWLMSVGMVSLAVAAAGPREPLARESKNVDAIAIVMAVDVSGSMEALDLTPKGVQFSKDTTRLAVVKKVFADFVSKRPDDLIGLVTFGTFASARAPLTADHATLLHVLEGVDIPDGEDEAETAIGDGLSVALLRIKDAKPKSKIIILLSDGLCNEGVVSPEQATASAAKMGVKVYTIGVGTKAAYAPRLVYDRTGRQYVRNYPAGFDEKQLKAIAKGTDGMYFAVNDREALENALAEIDKLETTPIEADEWNRWNEFFAPFLVAGTVCVFFAACFSMAAVRRMA